MSNIYLADPGLIIGFHGCDQDVCDSIIAGRKQMKASNNTWDWLGDGMYFWQNNYERAWCYANNPPGKSRINKPAVLGAVFCLGHCLDLTEQAALDIVKASYYLYRVSFDSKEKQMPVNTNPVSAPNSLDHIIRRLDCAVIKKVHEFFYETAQQPFDSVRALLPEGEPLYKGAGFRDKTHIQIAIRNPNMIKGFFLPRKGIAWSGIPLSLPGLL